MACYFCLVWYTKDLFDLFSVTSEEEAVNRGREVKLLPEFSAFINGMSLKLTPVITLDNW